MSKTNQVNYMMRQDGTVFPVKWEVRGLRDDDLSTEAELASLMIAKEAKDYDLSKDIIDTWLAMLVESRVTTTSSTKDVDREVYLAVQALPYKFAEPLTVTQYMNLHKQSDNYSNGESLHAYLKTVRASRNRKIKMLQDAIRHSANQQFVRIEFDVIEKPHSNFDSWHITFRIGSFNFSWADNIYNFVDAIVTSQYSCKGWTITIMRDNVVDYSPETNFEYYISTGKQVYKDYSLLKFNSPTKGGRFKFSLLEDDDILCKLSKGSTLCELFKHQKDYNDALARLEEHEYKQGLISEGALQVMAI